MSASFSQAYIGYADYEFRRTWHIAPEREPMRDPFEPEEAPFPIWCITPLGKRAARLSDINVSISVWIADHPEEEFIPNWYEWIHGCMVIHKSRLSEWLIRLDVAYNPDKDLEYWNYGNYGPENTIIVWKRGVRPSLKEIYER